MDILNTDPAGIEVGVIGIGLMGSSIIVSLLASGHLQRGSHSLTRRQNMLLYQTQAAGLGEGFFVYP